MNSSTFPKRLFTGSSLRGGMLAALVLLIGGASAWAVPVATDYSLSASNAYMFNDRIGNSRFFSLPNTDAVRVGIYASPSPDTNSLPVFQNGIEYVSSNGSDTLVGLEASRNVGLLPTGNTVGFSFQGLSSGRGGGRNEYTTLWDRNSLPAGMLEAWDATPLTISVYNPRSPGTTFLTLKTPDFNKDALPGFVTDLKLIGGGLTPKIEWAAPSSGTTPTSVSIQIRRINSESDDRSRITSATLVDTRTLPVGTNSYDFGQIFSNAGILGFPDGLELGKKYEISVQLDVSAPGGALNGRSRTFFEFTPLADGQGTVAVVLPSVGPDGVFKFNVAVGQGETIALDPVVAIGYEYQIGAGDPLFASVSLPNIGDGIFDLYLFDGVNYVFKQVLLAGEKFFFDGLGVDRFKIMGIEASSGIDPNDTTAFITDVTFAGSGRFTGTMTPITLEVSDVPEPSGIALVLLGIAALAYSRRQRVTMRGAGRNRTSPPLA